MCTPKLYIFLAVVPMLVSSFYIKQIHLTPEDENRPLVTSDAVNNSSDNSESLNQPDDGNKDGEESTVKFTKPCYTWSQDTFDLLGHLLDSIMILLNEMDVCEDGQEVRSMWGDNVPTPALNQHGK